MKFKSFTFELFLWERHQGVLHDVFDHLVPSVLELLEYSLIYFRRIAYQESTQTFGVISMRIEVLDPATNTTRPLHPSASTMAQNITSSVTAAMPGTSAGSSAGNRGAADGITFGDEVERSSLLIIDQHTFEGT